MFKRYQKPCALLDDVGIAGALLYLANEVLQVHANPKNTAAVIERISGPLRSYGEFALEHPIEHNWFIGHMSNFGAAVMVTYPLVRMASGANRELQQRVMCAGAAAMLSHLELISQNPDPEDMFCYMAGAAVTYLAARISAKSGRATAQATQRVEDLVDN